MTSNLEPKHGPERDSQIVMSPVVEVHLVADVEPQSDRSEMPLQSTARIQNRAHIIGSQIAHAADKCAHRRRRTVDPEINESALHKYEWLDRMMPNVQPRSELTMKRP
jgi:hypothetical protein